MTPEKPRPDCWPFDPEPPKKAPAIDGFIWCHDCDQVVSAVKHECRCNGECGWGAPHAGECIYAPSHKEGT